VSVTLTAIPVAGSVFSGWSGDCAGTGACTLAMSADHAVTATFVPAHTLTVSLSGSGAGTVTAPGISCPGTCSASYPVGTAVTLTAAPSAGSTFSGWSGGCTGTSTCQITLGSDQAVSATFLRLAPSITALSESASVWREGSKLAFITRTRKPPIGTVFSFDLNEPATVTLKFFQRRAGRKVHGRCVAESKKNKGKPRCTRQVLAGALTRPARKGANHIHFAGRLSQSRRLRPGSYTLTVSATDSAQRRSSSRSLSFTIVR
jgi:hypothetical protein